jgi:hypothetical protein
MYLKGVTKDHCMGFLGQAFPKMVEGYGRLYAGAYAAPDYVKQVRAMIEMFKQRHGVAGKNREFEDAEPDERVTPAAAEPRQALFRFHRSPP